MYLHAARSSPHQNVDNTQKKRGQEEKHVLLTTTKAAQLLVTDKIKYFAWIQLTVSIKCNIPTMGLKIDAGCLNQNSKEL